MEEGDLSTQSIIKAFSICPIPTRGPARDDDGSEQHTVISEGANDKNAAPIPVISTEAKRSGEISFLPWYMKHGGRKSLGSESP